MDQDFLSKAVNLYGKSLTFTGTEWRDSTASLAQAAAMISIAKDIREFLDLLKAEMEKENGE